MIPQPGMCVEVEHFQDTRKLFVHFGHLQKVEMEDTQARGLIVFFLPHIV